LEKRWHLEGQCLGGLQIDHQLELGRALDRQLTRFSALEDAVDVLWRLAKLFGEIRTIRNQAA
jgi:hypothetical protein